MFCSVSYFCKICFLDFDIDDVLILISFNSNPSPDSSLGFEWPEFDTENLAYVNIEPSLTVGSAPDDEHIRFWKTVFDYAGFDF